MTTPKSNSFFCFGDVHNYVDSAQRFLDYEKPKKVIWLGDFMDNFGDTPAAAEKTAEWLAHTVKSRPNDIFICGNHDIAYRYSTEARFQGWGFSPEKCRAFYSKFDRKLWERFSWYHVEEWNGQKIVFSHAGLHRTMFPREVFNQAHLDMLVKRAEDSIYTEKIHPLFDYPVGMLWIRWPDLPLCDGISQVVGHTPYAQPQIRAVKASDNWNLLMDCAKNYYAVFKETNAYAFDRNKGYEKLLRFKVTDNDIAKMVK